MTLSLQPTFLGQTPRRLFVGLRCLMIWVATWMSASLCPDAHAQTTLVQGDFGQQLVPAGAARLCVVPGDEVWVVSTRQSAPCSNTCGNFSVARYNGCEFTDETIEALQASIATNPFMTNVIHVHGDFTDLDWAVERGGQVYSNAVACVPARQSVRFIIWAWRAERVAIPIRDFRIKRDWSTAEGCRIHDFMDHVGMLNGIIIGYSMGAQAVVKALEQCSLHESPNVRVWQVLIVAPVFDDDYRPQVGSLGTWDSLIEEMVLVGNSGDRVLRAAARLNCGRSAVDQNNMACRLPISNDRITRYDVRRESGKKHSIARYSQTSVFVDTMACWLSLAGAVTEVSPDPQSQEAPPLTPAEPNYP